VAKQSSQFLFPKLTKLSILQIIVQERRGNQCPTSTITARHIFDLVFSLTDVHSSLLHSLRIQLRRVEQHLELAHDWRLHFTLSVQIHQILVVVIDVLLLDLTALHRVSHRLGKLGETPLANGGANVPELVLDEVFAIEDEGDGGEQDNNDENTCSKYLTGL